MKMSNEAANSSNIQVNPIQEKFNALLKEKFGYDNERIALMQECSLLSETIGFSVPGLFHLLMEVEKTFEIALYKEDVLKFQFDDYNELVAKIGEKVNQM